MGYEIPADIEPELQAYARAEEITVDEALIRLIKTGLIASRNGGIKDGAVDAFELIRRARAARTEPKPISASDFFAEIQKTRGLQSKEEAHLHVQELRSEWQS